MQKNPHILIFDGYNILHRARSGFKLGEHPVVFNFFRALRSEIEKHKPTRVVFVTEGTPKRQLAIDSEYKGNRRIEPNTAKEKEYFDFLRQKEIILQILGRSFPVSIVRHPDFEADDTIHNLVKNFSRAIPITVVSTDTDFLQLYDYFENVFVYNPVKKEIVNQPVHPCPYVAWKALRGDKTDNIPGIPGIGDKKANEIVKVAKDLNEWLNQDPIRLEIWKKNFEMIRFKDYTNEELMNVTSTIGERSWETVNEAFVKFGFQSITNPSSWDKFVSTFDGLF